MAVATPLNSPEVAKPHRTGGQLEFDHCNMPTRIENAMYEIPPSDKRNKVPMRNAEVTR